MTQNGTIMKALFQSLVKRMISSNDLPHQSGLARPVFSHESMDFTLSELEVHAIQGFDSRK
jgi:hypothetical protein